MSRLPEGVRRLCVVVGVVFVVAMLITSGNTLRDWLALPVDRLAFSAVIFVGFYLSPFIVCRVAFWIKDGFTKSGA
ncbi:hypothetical protein [Pseudomonas sp. HN2-3]|uniref:hypothetical protein n=1 Tax=Pseudomonas sp. HN2-3 TaxID=2886360 RepID=UPI001D11B3F2|nr:hypothetical protein [Pseudomonas sp. HN2-3]UDU80134.1 hypothetical protein LJX93_20410 [Pseudomonas sp. HN2-3]